LNSLHPRMYRPLAKLLIWLQKSSFATFGLKVGESTPGKRLWTDWPR
jgi:hypothetical protein